MKIDLLEAYPANQVYFSSSFRIVLDDHINFLKNHPETISIQVSPIEALKYVGDLSGLLFTKNVNVNLHWVIMRMNGFTSPADTDGNVSNLIIPSESVVERLRVGFMTENKIKA